MEKPHWQEQTCKIGTGDLETEADALEDGVAGLFVTLGLGDRLAEAVFVAFNEITGMLTMLTPPLEMRNWSTREHMKMGREQGPGVPAAE